MNRDVISACSNDPNRAIIVKGYGCSTGGHKKRELTKRLNFVCAELQINFVVFFVTIHYADQVKPCHTLLSSPVLFCCH